MSQINVETWLHGALNFGEKIKVAEYTAYGVRKSTGGYFSCGEQKPWKTMLMGWVSIVGNNTHFARFLLRAKRRFLEREFRD